MSRIKLNKYLSKIYLSWDIFFIDIKFSLRSYELVVVIPVYGEYEYIGLTLNSLVKNDIKILADTLILLVINNPELNPKRGYVEENQKLLSELNNKTFIKKNKLNNLNLAWIDASSKRGELPGKGGVGVARKLGMDSVLKYLDWNSKPLIFCLDADTIVEKNYLFAVKNYFEKNDEFIAASINFRHLSGKTPEEEKAIREYEYSIRYYVENLKRAGSPYAYYTIGSAIVCRADFYIKAGGMRQHRGGEDFYFMQQLRKLGKIGEILETTVYQSARPSDRVPFGTGPKVRQSIDGHEILLYNPTVFDTLKNVIDKAERWIAYGDVSRPENFIGSISKDSESYFLSLKFDTVWPNILNNNVKCAYLITVAERKKLRWAFHVWFDAFKTLKLIHFLERNYPEKYNKVRNELWNI